MARHRESLPILNTVDESIARDLHTAQIAVRNVEFGEDVRQSLTHLLRRLESRCDDAPVTRLPLGLLEDDASLFRWGLDERNLDITERYIGLPVRYQGLEVKVERALPAGAGGTPREWHIDAEDRRMLKIVIYLSDVDESTGPFEYLPRQSTELARRELGCRPGITFASDDAVADIVPRDQWRAVSGPAGTAVYVDTCRLLHRIRAPRRADRYSATFVYASDQPFHAFTRFMPPRDVVRSVAETLTPRQLRALPHTVTRAPARVRQR